MKSATLTTQSSDDAGTFGLWESGTFTAVTCERPPTGDHPCIPAGVYQVEMRYSPAHKDLDLGYGKGMVYGLKDVPGRTDIEIHPGNWPFQLLGCIAPGAQVAMLDASGKGPLKGVTSSIMACKALYADMAGGPFQLTVKRL